MLRVTSGLHTDWNEDTDPFIDAVSRIGITDKITLKFNARNTAGKGKNISIYLYQSDADPGEFTAGVCYYRIMKHHYGGDTVSSER